jgi:hypothetical protein
MVTPHLYAACELGIVRSDGAAFAASPQILPWIKAEAASDTE